MATFNLQDTDYVEKLNDLIDNAGRAFTKGIKFGNTPHASVDVLDYYQEGTFTPVVVGQTTAGVGTYVTQVGHYTRVGRIVYYVIDIAHTAHTGTGNMVITGLPFQCGPVNCPGSFRAENLAIPNKQGSMYVPAGQSYVAMETLQTGGAAVPMPVDTTFAAQIAGWYMV